MACTCDQLTRNYTIERGVQFLRQVTVTSLAVPVDLTGVTFLGNIRVSLLPTDIGRLPQNTGDVVTDMDLELANDPTTGVFTFGISIEKTLLLDRGEYDYDIVATFPDDSRQRILKGILTVVEVSSIEP